MSDDAIARRYAFAVDLIGEAGRLAQSHFRNRDALTIQSKGLQDMASEADLATEVLIRDRLAAAFPDDAFLGEETGRSEVSADRGIWVVDPIDGTQPFISGMSSWCVSIAYVEGGVLRFGMVYAPERDELFAGGKGLGATLNGAPLTPAKDRSIRSGIVGIGYSVRVKPERFLPVFGAFLKAGGMFSREGSGALTLAYVAAGRLVGYLELHINSWDCLGAIAVAEGAGLTVSDFLAGDGLHAGNPLVVGGDVSYGELATILAENT